MDVDVAYDAGPALHRKQNAVGRGRIGRLLVAEAIAPTLDVAVGPVGALPGYLKRLVEAVLFRPGNYLPRVARRFRQADGDGLPPAHASELFGKILQHGSRLAQPQT